YPQATGVLPYLASGNGVCSEFSVLTNLAVAIENTGTYPTILKIPTSFRKMCLKTLIFHFPFSISLNFLAQILLVG
ncbi:MAG: hypothetical protein V7K89_24305, partial [Nostoc sp.]|uniref:hypothetical protein n=1 Tax=Nostoc sp. TaxID=1180 RepID=UPI002FF4AC92